MKQHEIADRIGAGERALKLSDRVVDAITEKPERWIDFMMRFELGLEKPLPGRDVRSALTIGGAYVVGGLVPLIPYMLIPQSHPAFEVSAIVTFMALVLFGIFKGRFTGIPPVRAALQTVLIGGIAAIAAFLLARLVS